MKFIYTILIALVFIPFLEKPQPKTTGFKNQLSIVHQSNIEDSIQIKALNVLEKRCNICHRKKNPFRVFKEKNMNKNAEKIYKQVFVLKRMPKDGSKLSQSESDALIRWLESIKNKVTKS